VKAPARRYLLIVAFSLVLVVSATGAAALNTDFGRIEVTHVTIPDGSLQISGLLYRPGYYVLGDKMAGVVLGHGISESKETMSGIALELAKQGVVALTVDLVGHGGSGGAIGVTDDETLGMNASVRYLRSLPYVDPPLVGLVGHSLGAGAAAALLRSDSEIFAAALIGGGVGSQSSGAPTFNSTFPRNLLVVVGTQDVLFDISQLEASSLPPVFGSTQVLPGLVYGSFAGGNARELLTPATTHLFESIDPAVVAGIVQWFRSALLEGSGVQVPASNAYVARDALIALSLVGFVGLVFPMLELALKPSRGVGEIDGGPVALGTWKTMALWGALNLGLFLPMVFAGLVVSFPPLIFGSSIAWWLLATGLAGLVIARLFLHRIASIKEAFIGAFDYRGVAAAVGVFLLLYAVAEAYNSALPFSLRLIVPIFKGFGTIVRVPWFFALVPFFLVYFWAEGIIIHQAGTFPVGSLLSWGRSSLLAAIGIKVLPFLLLISVDYLPSALFGIRLFPSFVGFMIMFLWLIAPLFALTTAISWWSYRITGRVGTGAFLNALLMAWVAAVAFPLGAF
jgi:dienelactone hydrolase